MDMDIYSEETNLRLDERQLAEQLQISRTPIREALARLEREGFVEIRPRKGVFVRPKTLPEVLEIVVVWAALESMAARLVTKVATDKEISTLRILGVKHSSDSNRADLEEYSEANIKFHQRILEAIENREGELAAMLVHDHTMKLHEHIKTNWQELQGGQDKHSG